MSGGWVRRLTALAAGRPGDGPRQAPVCLACRPFRIVHEEPAAGRAAAYPRGC